MANVKLIGLNWSFKKGDYVETEIKLSNNMFMEVNEDDNVVDVNYPDGSFDCYDRIRVEISK